MRMAEGDKPALILPQNLCTWSQVTARHYSEDTSCCQMHMPAEEEESEDYRTSIVIPKTLQKSVAHYSIDHEVTFTEVVIDALKEYLAKHDRK